MRELKFRAWDNANNEWLNKEDAECLEIHLDGGYEINRGWAVIFPELTIEQYTGLKDKNGKEIYEGDIVAIHNKNNRDEYDIGIVGWKKGAFRCPFLLGKYRSSAIEIVGNIHENGKDTVFPMNSKQNKGDEK